MASIGYAHRTRDLREEMMGTPTGWMIFFAIAAVISLVVAGIWSKSGGSEDEVGGCFFVGIVLLVLALCSANYSGNGSAIGAEHLKKGTVYCVQAHDLQNPSLYLLKNRANGQTYFVYDAKKKIPFAGCFMENNSRKILYPLPAK